MSDDLVKRLRVNDAEIYLPILGQAADRIEELASMEECLTAELGDANDRIEALEAEVERLLSILEQWLNTAREHLDTEVAGRTFEALRKSSHD